MSLLYKNRGRSCSIRVTLEAQPRRVYYKASASRSSLHSRAAWHFNRSYRCGSHRLIFDLVEAQCTQAHFVLVDAHLRTASYRRGKLMLAKSAFRFIHRHFHAVLTLAAATSDSPKAQDANCAREFAACLDWA